MLRSLFLFFLAPSLTLASQGLVTLSKDFKPQGAETVITNMPRVRSQDSIGVCYSFAASTLIDEAICNNRNISDCSSASDDQKVSPLDLTRFNQNISENADKSDRFSYEGLSIDGGSVSFALVGALNSRYVVKESCAPFDQLVARTDNAAKARELESATWKRFEDSYNNYKNKVKNCVDCGLEYATAVGAKLKEEYNLKSTNADILEAFAQNTYSKFLDRLLVPDDCWDRKKQLEFPQVWDQKTFPQPTDKANYESSISKIKEVLGKKRPISIGFCTQSPLSSKKQSECGTMKDGKLVSGEGHAVVIKGYRRVCNPQGVCRDSLQVQNSWGQTWQNANDDGWVDAQELLKRTFYENHSMIWLEKKI